MKTGLGKHHWHGLTLLVIGLYLLGSFTVLTPELTVEAGSLWLAVVLLLMGAGGFLTLFGKKLFEQKNLFIEYYDAIVMALAIAFVVRTFIIEPFKIPSGSMIPTLLVGDYLFVNKFAYGYRTPFARQRLFMEQGPRRGDVAVFKYPVEPDKNYIKRIVGLPGDRVIYRDKQLMVNGVTVAYETNGTYQFQERNEGGEALRLKENLDGVIHDILVQPTRYPERITDEVVPARHYFVLGDNRDNSRDSRFWGFVPDYWLVGRAVVLFWSWDSNQENLLHRLRWERLGQSIH